MVGPQKLCLESLAARRELRRAFRSIDVATTMASAAALAALRPAVAIVDRLMPGQRVRTAISQLRRASPKTRFVVLAELPLTTFVDEAVESGAAGLVTLRMSFEEFLDALRLVGKGATWFPAPATRKNGAAAAHPQGIERLTARELDVMICLARGLPLAECAAVLGLRPSTADNHRTRLMGKLGVHRTIDLAWLALREGLLSPW